MASDQLWGSLVKAMTKKIEVPGMPAGGELGGRSTSSRQPAPGIPTGRRQTDPLTHTGSHPAPESPRSPTVTSREGAIERISAHLPYLTRKQIEDYLEHHGGKSGPIAQRMDALGLIPGGEAGGSGVFWWQAVSKGWL